VGPSVGDLVGILTGGLVGEGVVDVDDKEEGFAVGPVVGGLDGSFGPTEGIVLGDKVVGVLGNNLKVGLGVPFVAGAAVMVGKPALSGLWVGVRLSPDGFNVSVGAGAALVGETTPSGLFVGVLATGSIVSAPVPTGVGAAVAGKLAGSFVGAIVGDLKMGFNVSVEAGAPVVGKPSGLLEGEILL
jgi:hypothetical protein